MAPGSDLGSLNDLTSKWRRSNIVTNKSKHLRTLRPHVTCIKMRSIFKRIGGSQYSLANLIRAAVRIRVKNTQVGREVEYSSDVAFVLTDLLLC